MEEVLDAEALDEIIRRLTTTMNKITDSGEDSLLYDQLQPIKPRLRRAAFLAAYVTRQLGG